MQCCDIDAATAEHVPTRPLPDVQRALPDGACGAAVIDCPVQGLHIRHAVNEQPGNPTVDGQEDAMSGIVGERRILVPA